MSNTGVVKPVLVYDGDCAFCRLWIERWKVMTGERVEYEPSATAALRFPQIPPEEFSRAVQLVTETGEVFSGAHAVFRTLKDVPRKGWLVRAYGTIPGIAPAAEACYRFVAGHRNALYRATRLLWGSDLRPSSYHLTRWLFLRCLGVIYLIAFLSLAVQVTGLVGSDGILPAGRFLESVRMSLGARGYAEVPTLAWFGSDNSALLIMCWAGAAISLLLIAGVIPKIAAAVLWILYLSLVAAGQEFLAFQWDILLVETGFLAILLAPTSLRSVRTRRSNPSGAAVWLVRLLLFRLMFFSGFVKLASGDPSWHNLTALTFHFETQPLPTPLGWYAHQLPAWLQELVCALMFVVELGLPFLIFGPRRLRMAAGASFALFMVLIMLTGNYTFFNLLALILCIILFDDRALHRLQRRQYSEIRPPARSRAGRIALGGVAALLLLLNAIQWYRLVLPGARLPQPVSEIAGVLAPFYLVNRYGLFAVMTNPRNEIIVETSDDGSQWRELELRDKPGDVMRTPPWVAPHQPRLDWQMWFAALGNYRNNPWFINFCVRILQGSPDVLRLLPRESRPANPPRYVRALLYEYHFTDEATRRSSGAWWVRELKGIYLPSISLRE